MQISNRILSILLASVFATVMLTHLPQLEAQTAMMTHSSGGDTSANTRWSVQVIQIDHGDVNLEPSFQIAIYENLLDELGKTKRFRHVFRDGDRSAGNVSNLLILKTTVKQYTPGSETRRAVTTVSGATKLSVRSQLCTRDGHIVLEDTVHGNVRFLGSNLRATHNLAHNMAKTIKQASLSERSLPVFGSGAQ
ncbi:MAG: hypothetical protein WA817_05315 [Candidatus Acidiferrum sp.]